LTTVWCLRMTTSMVRSGATTIRYSRDRVS
jgi:hypothetical protein